MSGNIASFLKILEVESMYLPVPVNFIFIGFEGKGNQGICVAVSMYYFPVQHVLFPLIFISNDIIRIQTAS